MILHSSECNYEQKYHIFNIEGATIKNLTTWVSDGQVLFCRNRQVGLLEGLLYNVPDGKKDNGTDNSAYNLAIPLSPERTGGAKFAKQPAADKTAGKTDEDVPDKTAFVFGYEEAGKPACYCSDEQCDNDVHGTNI